MTNIQETAEDQHPTRVLNPVTLSGVGGSGLMDGRATPVHPDWAPIPDEAPVEPQSFADFCAENESVIDRFEIPSIHETLGMDESAQVIRRDAADLAALADE